MRRGGEGRGEKKSATDKRTSQLNVSRKPNVTLVWLVCSCQVTFSLTCKIDGVCWGGGGGPRQGLLDQ